MLSDLESFLHASLAKQGSPYVCLLISYPAIDFWDLFIIHLRDVSLQAKPYLA